MTGFESPAWLLALAAVPLVRWLHRFNEPARALPVGALFPWRGAQAPAGGGRERRPPDPAWRRRALVVALLAIALAEPGWRAEVKSLTVWIDDSLSMATEEDGRPRLAAGLEKLRRALDAADVPVATLRSLGDAALARKSSDPAALDPAAWLTSAPRPPAPPPVALLSPDGAHWLVTDGADPAVLRWARAAPLERVIAVGARRDNVAVTRLAARQALDGEERYELLIEVSNRSAHAATRDLTVRIGSQVVERRPLALAPAETRRITLEQRIADGVSALVSPGDALHADDSLALEATAFAPPTVSVDPHCPAPLRRALAAHPGLRAVADTPEADLEVACSARHSRSRSLYFHGGASRPLAAAPAWTAAAGALGDLRLDPGRLGAVEPAGGAGRGLEPLLAADGRTLVAGRAGVRAEVWLDMGHSPFAAQPEYAALVARLLDFTLGRPVLDRVLAEARPPSESDIAPAVPEVKGSAASAAIRDRRSPAPALLAAALALLLFDLLLAWRSPARLPRE